ncbi:MAG: response regulator transcription factor, partial [Candidatus Acidiferrum sp.]
PSWRPGNVIYVTCGCDCRHSHCLRIALTFRERGMTPIATNQHPALRSCRILVADDHAVVRESVCVLLSQNSRWQVCGEAANGVEAIEKVRQLRPDLIVLDLSMPVMNGIEAAREIRRIAPAIKILIFTGQSASEVDLAARRAGADAVVSKADIPSLMNAVECFASRPLMKEVSDPFSDVLDFREK